MLTMLQIIETENVDGKLARKAQKKSRRQNYVCKISNYFQYRYTLYDHEPSHLDLQCLQMQLLLCLAL